MKVPFLLFFSFIFSNAFAAIYYTKASGFWDNAGTWGTACASGTGAVPGINDDVIICSGYDVTMRGNPGSCNSLTLAGGTIHWTATRTTNVGAGGLILQGGFIGQGSTKTGTLNVSGNLSATTGTTNFSECNLTISGTSTINNGVIVNITNATGTKDFGSLIISGTFNNVANSAITISGNLQNDNSFTAGSGTVTFTGASNNTITGTQTTAFTSLNINKGTSSANVLDVQSFITLTDGGLTLTNGTLKLSNSSISITPFTADPNIPSTAGLWCNGAIINSGNFSWTVLGLLQVSAGEVNIGNSTNNNLQESGSGTSQLIVDGGTLNVAGAIRQTVTNTAFTISDGTIVAPAVGLTTVGISPIQIDQASTTFTMSGGTIVLRQAGATNLGFTATAGTVNVSGGTIQIGDGGTPGSPIININSAYSIANLSVNNINATARLATNALSVLQSISISSGTLDANNLNIALGNSWTNNGTWIPGTGTITFNGTGTQTIIKTGGETFNNVTIDKPSGTVTLSNNLQVNSTLTMTAGSIDCGSSTITLGTSAVSPGTLTYSSGTIIGTFKRWVNSTGVGILFPIGTSSYYRSALLTFTDLASGTLTANFVSSDPGGNGLPLSESGKSIANQYTEGYWNFVAADALSSTNYALELTGNGFTSYSVSPSTRLLYRASGGDLWSLNGTHSDASGNTAKRTGVNGISTAQFGFGKPACSAFLATSITGNTSACISTTEAYSTDANNPANTYTWVITGGAQNPVNTDPSISVDWGATGMVGDVQVTEQNDCGDNNAPVNLAVNIHGIPTSAISGSTSVAINESAQYSVTLNSGYTYTWTLVPPGSGSISPPSSGVDVNSVTVVWGATPGTYSVKVDVIPSPCGSPDFQTLSVTVKSPIISTASGGNWTMGGTWVGGVAPTSTDYAEITGGSTVTINNSSAACFKLTINGTATWSQARTLTVGNGGVVVNSTGDIAGTGAGTLISTGGFTGNSNADISSSSVNIILQTTGGQSINSAGAFKKLQIDAATTNTGTLKIANGGTLSGSSTLTQAAGATLTMNGSTFTLTTLDATSAGNMVIYGANADQTIRNATYDDLTLSGTGTKILGGSITVNDDLAITGVTLDASTSNYPITISGDWTNTGTFTPRFATVTFNSASSQTITKSGGETFHNLVFSGDGTKTLANDVTINFDFTNGSAFDVSSNNINIKGNFDNSGSVTSTNNVTFSNNTTVSGPSTTIFNNVIITGTLTGHLSNFNVSGSWTNNGTFTHNGGKVTFDGNTTVSGSSETTFGNVDITGTVTASSGNMNIARNFNNSGTFNHNNGTLTFNGNVAQTIQGNNTYNNLTVDNSSVGGVAVTSGTQNLINTLTLTDGNLNTNGNLILVSNASGTARIAEITAGSISGNITMQRHIPSAATSWRQLGTAVSGQTLAEWKDDFYMSGFPGSHNPSYTFVSVMTYNETVAGGASIGWEYPSDISNSIGVGQGFMCYVGNGGANIDADVTGNTNTGNISLSLDYTNTGFPFDDGWNLVANPYPSNIDWDIIFPTTSNVSATVAVWNPATQNYGQYTFGGPNPGPNGGVPIINSTQAFWVQTTGASPSVDLTEPVKTATTQSFFKLAGDPDVLKLKIESSNNYSDETFIYFKDNASVNYNSSEDALKMFSSYDVPHLATVINDSLKLALNSFPPLLSDVIIPIHAGGKATLQVISGTDTFFLCNKTFTISAQQLDAISESVCIILEDTKTGAFTNLRDTSYTFTVGDTSNLPNTPRYVPALTSSPRFLIHIGSGIEKSSITVSCSGVSDGMAIAKGKGNGPFDYTWKNQNNSVVKVTSAINTADTLKNISGGTYTVEISGNSGFCSQLKDTIIVNENPAAIEIISDNTGTSCFGENDGEITLFVSGDNSPFTYLWSNGVQTQNIVSLQAGNYTVTVTDSQNCSASQTIVVSQPDAVTALFEVQDTIYLSDGGNANFENTSASSDYYMWNFGDGSAPDSSFNPVHTYTQTGTYTVTLSVSSESCGDDVTASQITVLQTNPNVGINPSGILDSGFEIYPNPNDGKFTIYNLKSIIYNLEVFNVIGEKIYSEKNVNRKSYNLNLPSGIYFLKIISEEKVNTVKIIVK